MKPFSVDPYAPGPQGDDKPGCVTIAPGCLSLFSLPVVVALVALAARGGGRR